MTEEKVKLAYLSSKEFWVSRNANTKGLEKVSQNILKDVRPEFKKHFGCDLDLDAGNLERQVNEQLDVLRGQLNSRRESTRRSKKVGKHVQDSMTACSEFFQAYAGLADIMKGASQEYGALAYGTFAVFLAVAASKTGKELIIKETFHCIQGKLNRMKRLQVVHGTAKMQELVCEAYTQSLLFLRWATNYWSVRAWRRVVRAVTDPPQLTIEKQVNKLLEAMEEIRSEVETSDTEALGKAKVEIQEARIEIRELKETIARLQADNFRAKIQALRVIIDPSFSDPYAKLMQYQDTLFDAFKNARRFKALELEDLQQTEVFNRWFRNEKSTLLLLYGETSHALDDFCWLSHCVVSLIRALQESNACYAFYLCRQMPDEDPVAPETLVQSWICQLLPFQRDLDAQEAILQQHANHVRDMVRGSRKLEALMNVIKSLTDGLDEVFLIIDRSDCLKGSTWLWLREMVTLLNKSEATVHLILVAEASGGFEDGKKLGGPLLEHIEGELNGQFFHLCLNSHDQNAVIDYAY